MLIFLLILTVALLLAFANGANDNAKGVATLIAGRLLSQRSAIFFAAVTTLMGSIAAIWLGGELAERFTGKGVIDNALLTHAGFPASIALAAGATVLIATRIAMPISTTHAIVGAMIGVGAASGTVKWTGVANSFIYPLLASPLLALGASAALYLILRSARKKLGVGRQTCLCIEQTYHPVSINPDGAAVVMSTGAVLKKDELANCRQRYDGVIAGVHAQQALNVGHLMSAGAISFARGLNDTPKIAAMMIAAGSLSNSAAVVWTGLAIAIGGLLAVRRVAQTMSHRITGMNDGQAFTANLTTAVLVIFASRWGLPVSTTHVSCGGLFGIGLVNRRARWKMIGAIVLAWAATLPIAAILGVVAWRVLAGL